MLYLYLIPRIISCVLCALNFPVNLARLLLQFISFVVRLSSYLWNIYSEKKSCSLELSKINESKK